MTMQSSPLVKSAEFPEVEQQIKSDQLQNTESRDCANNVKKLLSPR
jgi:hypothetical protein